MPVQYPPQLEADRLPRGALPDIRFTRPELQYPDTLNVADHLLERNLAPAHAGRTAFFCGERAISYAQLNESVNRLGSALRSLDIGAGDRVVLRLPNSIEFAVCALALHRLGAVVVPTNVLLREPIVTHIVNRTAAKAIIVHQEFLDAVERGRAAQPALQWRIVAGGETRRPAGAACLCYEQLLESGSASLVSAPVPRDALAAIFFTSGTSGLPKGCMHLAGTLLAGAHAGLNMYDAIRPDDVVSGTPPLAFTFGYGHVLLLPLAAGVPGVFIEGRATPQNVFRTIERRRVTLFHSVPSAYIQMLGAVADADRHDLTSLRATLAAGAPTPPTVFRAWQERFGTPIANAMGSSESFVSIFSRWLADPPPGAMGLPLPGWEVRVLDEDGQDAARGAIGRLAVRGPAGTLYWRDPAKQAEAVIEGWSLTGDLVRQDDEGCFWHECRNDDVIKSRGYRISPGEVEDALLAHAAVLEPAVIGAPDAVYGQRVKAFVTLRSGYQPSDALVEELRNFARERLAPYQVPAEIEFIDAMPKTETGKILRRELRERERARTGGVAHELAYEPAVAAGES